MNVKGSEVRREKGRMNTTRTGMIQTIIEMGGEKTTENRRTVGGEEVGDLVVKASQLTGIVVPEERAKSMIDEYPALAMAAAFAVGP